MGIKKEVSVESILFATPEQRLLRILLSEPTTSLSPRNLSNRLKGVRGLGGQDGIKKILDEFTRLELVRKINNNQEVMIQNESTTVKNLKIFTSMCDLQAVIELLKEHCSAIALRGPRAIGDHTTECTYELAICTSDEEAVREMIDHSSLAKKIEIQVLESVEEVEKTNEPSVLLWSATWV